MSHNEDITEQITALAGVPDSEIRVAWAALLIARAEYPDLDESLYLDRLRDLGSRLKSRITANAEPEQLIDALNHLLFVEEGFSGNSTNYFDPRNSFLNDVIDRKLGIPITLAIIYLEVGRQAGMPLYGIGLPGHFIVGLLTDTGRVLIDPFNQGRVLSEASCRRMVETLSHGSIEFQERFLQPVWPKSILVRLLRNLKGIYMHAGSDLKGLQTIDWILTLDPESPLELRERAKINQALGDIPKAVRDLERYLDVWPHAEDADDVRIKVQMLRQRKTLVH